MRRLNEVVQHRDHPSLLFWGLGNEAEVDGNNAALKHLKDFLGK